MVKGVGVESMQSKVSCGKVSLIDIISGETVLCYWQRSPLREESEPHSLQNESFRKKPRAC